VQETLAARNDLLEKFLAMQQEGGQVKKINLANLTSYPFRKASFCEYTNPFLLKKLCVFNIGFLN